MNLGQFSTQSLLTHKKSVQVKVARVLEGVG